MKPRSLSVKQYESVLELLKAVKDYASAAEAEYDDGIKGVRDTEAYKAAREKMAAACLILGIETPKVFETLSTTETKEAEETEEVEEALEPDEG